MSADKAAPPVVHIGTIARELREAHMTRMAFAEAVNISLVDYSRWEEGRKLLTTEQLQRVLRHPIMTDLAARAAAAGIVPPAADQPLARAAASRIGRGFLATWAAASAFLLAGG